MDSLQCRLHVFDPQVVAELRSSRLGSGCWYGSRRRTECYGWSVQ